ncbi:hypothetical protein KAZ93_01985 [Patescibacteria group bacterium]|nr:hypothetical protein [Patescibacteria group bacterium]
MKAICLPFILSERCTLVSIEVELIEEFFDTSFTICIDFMSIDFDVFFVEYSFFPDIHHIIVIIIIDVLEMEEV